MTDVHYRSNNPTFMIPQHLLRESSLLLSWSVLLDWYLDWELWLWYCCSWKWVCVPLTYEYILLNFFFQCNPVMKLTLRSINSVALIIWWNFQLTPTLPPSFLFLAYLNESKLMSWHIVSHASVCFYLLYFPYLL